jgi:hypothetical protein
MGEARELTSGRDGVGRSTDASLTDDRNAAIGDRTG